MTETLALSLPAALLLGLAFGAGPCLLTCLPYAGPLLTLHGGESTVRLGVLPFLAGRLTTYTTLATLAGWGRATLLQAFPQGGVTVLLGGVTVAAGVALWRSGQGCQHPAPPATEGVAPIRRRPAPKPATPLTLYLMGATLAASPCIPLSTVLAAAAASASPWLGGGMGLAFGLGAVAVPGLVLAGLAGSGGARIRAEIGPYLPAARRGGALLLLLLGSATALGWVAP